MILVRVSGLTRWGAENARETVEMWTPAARATSLMVAGTGTPQSADRCGQLCKRLRACQRAAIGPAIAPEQRVVPAPERAPSSGAGERRDPRAARSQSRQTF